MKTAMHITIMALISIALSVIELNGAAPSAGVSTTTGVIGALAGYLLARKKISG